MMAHISATFAGRPSVCFVKAVAFYSAGAYVLPGIAVADIFSITGLVDAVLPTCERAFLSRGTQKSPLAPNINVTGILAGAASASRLPLCALFLKRRRSESPSASM